MAAAVTAAANAATAAGASMAAATAAAMETLASSATTWAGGGAPRNNGRLSPMLLVLQGRLNTNDLARELLGISDSTSESGQRGLDASVIAEVERQLRLLLPLAALAVICFVIGLGTQAVAAGQGWVFLWCEHGKLVPRECIPLEHWLFTYCISVTLVPCCGGVSGLLAAACAVSGPSVRDGLPHTCQSSVPHLWGAVDRVFGMAVGSLICLPFAASFGTCAWRRLEHIRRRWGGEGAALGEVVDAIFEGPPAEPPINSECAICLEGSAGEAEVERGSLLTEWRALPCGHRFHGVCLREWLLRARRCPLCRLDLHLAVASTP